MRRTLILTVSLLFALTSLSPAASADSTLIVHGLGLDYELGIGLTETRCSSPGDATPVGYSALYGWTDDPTSALGQSKVTFGTPGYDDAVVGPYVLNPTPAAAGTFDVRLNTINGFSQGLAIVVYNPDSSSNYWEGTAPVSSTGDPGDWVTIDAENLALDWKHWDASSQTWETPVTGVTRTAFVAAHGGNGEGAAQALAFGCGHSFFLDRFRAGPTGDITTIDFEGFRTKTTGTASTSILAVGSPVTFKGVTHMEDGSPFATAYLALEKKVYGATSWSVVKDHVPATYEVGTDTQTPAVLTQKPTRLTYYRWRYPATPDALQSTSTVMTVRVRPTVTLSAEHLWVPRSGSLVVSGTTTPAKAGATITLQRRVGGIWKPWAYTKTTSTGRYRLVKPMSSVGTWAIRTVVSASTGNEVGYSPARSLKVHP